MVYEEIAQLPHFNSDVENAGRPQPWADLRARVGGADAVLISTPKYAGGVEEPAGVDDRRHRHVRHTGRLDNPSTAPRRAAGTYATLDTVLRCTGAAIVPDACRDIPVSRSHIGAAGTVDEATVRESIESVDRTLTRSIVVQ